MINLGFGDGENDIFDHDHGVDIEICRDEILASQDIERKGKVRTSA